MHICGNYKQYYPLSVEYTPPLYNSKQAGKLHLDRSSGKLFPSANYGAAIFGMQVVQRKLSPSIGLESW